MCTAGISVFLSVHSAEGPDPCELAQNPRYRKGPDVCFDNNENVRQSHTCALVQRILLETALLARLHNLSAFHQEFAFCVDWKHCLVSALHACCIFDLFIHFLVIGHLAVLFNVISPFYSFVDIFMHSIFLSFIFSSLFYVSASHWLLLLSGRTNLCVLSAAVLQWDLHPSCCFWFWFQGPFHHTASKGSLLPHSPPPLYLFTIHLLRQIIMIFLIASSAGNCSVII